MSTHSICSSITLMFAFNSLVRFFFIFGFDCVHGEIWNRFVIFYVSWVLSDCSLEMGMYRAISESLPKPSSIAIVKAFRPKPSLAFLRKNKAVQLFETNSKQHLYREKYACTHYHFASKTGTHKELGIFFCLCPNRGKMITWFDKIDGLTFNLW